jgi:hypothetical protein
MKSTSLKIGLYCLLLVTSLMAHSNEMHKQVTLENIVINYHFKDLKSLSKETEINELISKAFNSYTLMFNGLPRDPAGNSYFEISLHIKHGKYLGGEADPKFIEITWNDEIVFGFATWKTLLLHELFHLWNGESFRYQSGEEHWFNEGFTEYYTYKTALQLGLISSKDALSIAAKAVGFYSASKGLGTLSMREAGRSNKSKFDN